LQPNRPQEHSKRSFDAHVCEYVDFCPEPNGPPTACAARPSHPLGRRQRIPFALCICQRTKRPRPSRFRLVRHDALQLSSPGAGRCQRASQEPMLVRLAAAAQAATASPPLTAIFSPSGPALTSTVSPSLSEPSSSIPARRFCSSRWITLFSGRAP